MYYDENGNEQGLLYGAAVINSHGQIVIPAKFRKRYGMQEGDTVMLMANPNSDGFTVLTPQAMAELQSQVMAANMQAQQAIND